MIVALLLPYIFDEELYVIISINIKSLLVLSIRFPVCILNYIHGYMLPEIILLLHIDKKNFYSIFFERRRIQLING